VTGEALLTFSEHIVLSASWSPDGRRIVSGGQDGSAKVWDVGSGAVLLDLLPDDFEFPVGAVAWSPDGTRIVGYSEDSLARIWDAETGEQLLEFAAVTNLLPEVFWSPAGDRLLASGGSGAATVWDTTTGHELYRLELGASVGASWSPDASLLAVGDIRSNLQVYPAWRTLDELIAYAREHAVIRQLTDAEREQFGLAPE
jgi:WD40 repeat protein